MTNKIFKSFIFIAFTVLIISLGSSLFAFSYYLNKDTLNDLKNECKSISEGVDIGGIDYLKALPQLNKRITYIDKNGNVLFDSSADINKMDNHKERSEVKEAQINGEGSSERFSKTLSQKTFYYAMKLKNDNIVRISVTRESLLKILFSMFNMLSIIGIAIFIFSYILSKKLYNGIIKSDFIDLKRI